MADRSLVVRLVGDERDLLRAYSRSEKATKSFGRTTDTTLGKADKRFRTLKTAGAGLAGGFIASEVLATGKVLIDQAAESERVLTQVAQGLRNTGLSWEQYRGQIEKTVTAQSRLGFDDEALLESFDKFQRQTGNVTKALKLNAVAMDVARGRNITLEAATTLVTKAQAGQRGALTRLGIEVDKAATKTDLLRILTEKYGGSAEAASKDASTAMERLSVSVENVQESLGRKALPIVGQFADELAGAADATTRLIDNLEGLGKAKIPVIDIPVNFKLPGTDTKIGGALKKIFGEINPVTGRQSPIGALRTIRQAGNLFGDEEDRPRRKTAPAARPGTQPIVIENRVILDGETVGRSTKRFHERDARRNPRQKRGPNSAFR